MENDILDKFCNPESNKNEIYKTDSCLKRYWSLKEV